MNISPMGPIADTTITQLTLRPYQTSTTYQNLKRTRRGVFHVTDNVEMLARAAVGTIVPPPAMQRHNSSGGWILQDACRWYAFEVTAISDTTERTTLEATVTDCGRQRDFFGFNRAKHAVVEAAILATRTRFLPAEEIRRQMQHLATIVEKTAGDQERRAFEFLQQYVGQHTS